MHRFNLEFTVGLFVIVGMLCLTYLALRLGDVDVLSDESYKLHARFLTVSGLREGATVEMAGIRIGKVSKLTLDLEYYEAIATLTIESHIPVQEDAIASVRTQGIIGDKFVKITPGGSDVLLTNGMEITETEPAISLEELIGKYIFEGS